MIRIVISIAFIALSSLSQTLPEFPKPIPADVLKIDVVDSVHFYSKSLNVLKVNCRLLVPDYRPCEVIVENLSEFPGAKFNLETSEFFWSFNSAPSSTTVHPLNFRVFAYPVDEIEPVITGTKTVLIFVSH